MQRLLLLRVSSQPPSFGWWCRWQWRGCKPGLHRSKNPSLGRSNSSSDDIVHLVIGVSFYDGSGNLGIHLLSRVEVVDEGRGASFWAAAAIGGGTGHQQRRGCRGHEQHTPGKLQLTVDRMPVRGGSGRHTNGLGACERGVSGRALLRRIRDTSVANLMQFQKGTKPE